MNRPRLLDLFCGAGGAAAGYHRAGFDVTGVDIAPQPHYPFAFVQADALEYVALHWREYDAIHASPPCLGYSVCTPIFARGRHTRLIGATRDVLAALAAPWVIENVPGALADMRDPVTLCGSMFGLPLRRHRLFEASFTLWPPAPCRHEPEPVVVSGVTRRASRGRREYSIDEKRAALGIDWPAPTRGIDQALPPAYTQHVGAWLLRAIGGAS